MAHYTWNNYRSTNLEHFLERRVHFLNHKQLFPSALFKAPFVYVSMYVTPRLSALRIRWIGTVFFPEFYIILLYYVILGVAGFLSYDTKSMLVKVRRCRLLPCFLQAYAVTANFIIMPLKFQWEVKVCIGGWL